MELINTTFESNTAYIGAALCREVNATGGHGFNNTFRDNHAEYAGAALAWVNADWGIDQYFGGDGGTILWSGDIGLVYNCSFVDSNSARRGGGAYMTGSDYVKYDNCTFINCTDFLKANTL